MIKIYRKNKLINEKIKNIFIDKLCIIELIEYQFKIKSSTTSELCDGMRE